MAAPVLGAADFAAADCAAVDFVADVLAVFDFAEVVDRAAVDRAVVERDVVVRGVVERADVPVLVLRVDAPVRGAVGVSGDVSPDAEPSFSTDSFTVASGALESSGAEIASGSESTP